MRSIPLRVFVLALAGSIMGCGPHDPVTTTECGSLVSVQNTPAAAPLEIQRPDGGRTFVRADGWPIPSLDAAEKEEFNTSVTTVKGRSIQVHRTSFRTDPLSLIADNPLYSIGIGLKKIRLNKVKAYRTDAGVFCYRFLVNDAEVDEATNKILSTRGILYPYSLYDEDGDGVFESLTINENDRNGRQIFESEPHLPEWAITKKGRTS